MLEYAAGLHSRGRAIDGLRVELPNFDSYGQQVRDEALDYLLATASGFLQAIAELQAGIESRAPNWNASENRTGLQNQLAVMRLQPELARAGVPAGAVDDVLRRMQADYHFVDGRLTPLDASVPSDIGEYLASLRTSAPHWLRFTRSSGRSTDHGWQDGS